MKTVLAIAAVAGLLAVPTAAHAEDRRPCVSKVEFDGAKYGQTRAQIEARWEVEGLGQLVPIPVVGYPADMYPRCGFSPDEAYFAVKYRHRKVVMYIGVKCPGIAPHGHNRALPCDMSLGT